MTRVSFDWEPPPTTCRQVRPWFGDSIGHWEGDTLVVETTNIHPTQLAQSSPLLPFRGASEKLKVTERFTRTGPNVLLYKFTMEDPSTFTAPFSGELPFNRIDEQIHEYACHEELRAAGDTGGARGGNRRGGLGRRRKSSCDGSCRIPRIPSSDR